MVGFSSTFRKVGSTELPSFSGLRLMMMPVIIGDASSLPELAAPYTSTFSNLSSMSDPCHLGKVGYLTVDEKPVAPNQTHRRSGKHVDGVYQGQAGGWGGGGGWGSAGAGMLTVSSHPGCIAWNQDFEGWPGWEGECDHLAGQCGVGTVFGANEVYWVDGLCVHESIPQSNPVSRQFVRLSMPSSAPWFEGYTVNPLGVLPTGEILPRRLFMDL